MTASGKVAVALRWLAPSLLDHLVVSSVRRYYRQQGAA